MERRYDDRFNSGLPVQVTGLDNAADPVSGILLDISVSGISTLLPVPMPTGSVVKLELAGTVLYGHIIYVTPQDLAFRTGVAVERVLVQSSDLSHILESVLDDDQLSACRQLLADASRA